MNVVEQDQNAVKVGLDATLAVPALTAPAWWPYVDWLGHVVLLIGGLVLLGYRIVIAHGEYKSRRGRRRRRTD